MSKNITSSYIPGTVPTIGNWPAKRHKTEKSKQKIEPDSETEVVLWDFGAID